jgi:hypothetical protein
MSDWVRRYRALFTSEGELEGRGLARVIFIASGLCFAFLLAAMFLTAPVHPPCSRSPNIMKLTTAVTFLPLTFLAIGSLSASSSALRTVSS